MAPLHADATLADDIRARLTRKDYSGLKERVAKAPPAGLRQAWLGLEPLEKAALFKLLEPRSALEFYRGLSYGDRYFLLGAFDLGVIAPLIEDAPPRVRALFRRLPEQAYDEMLRELRP